MPADVGENFRRMDLNERPTLLELTALLREGSTIEDPARMLSHFSRWYANKRPADAFVTTSRRNMPEGQYKITRLFSPGDWENRFEKSQREVPNPWRDWNKLESRVGGLLGRIMALEEPQLITDLDYPNDEVLGDFFAPFRTLIAIPNFDNGHALNWSFSLCFQPSAVTLEQLEAWMLDGNILGTATRNLVSKRELTRLNDELVHQLEEVAQVQRALLPQKNPDIPHSTIATSYLTSTHAGGDYYGFHHFPADRWGIMVADVSGHGAAAASVMAMLSAIMGTVSELDQTPDGYVETINRRLSQSLMPGMFVTAFFALLEPKTGLLEYVRCGHHAARIKRRGKVIPIAGTGTLPMGIMPELGSRHAGGEFQLEPGDTLVLFTDGLIEEFNDRGEMFGLDGLDAALADCDCSPDAVVDRVHAALYRHTGRRTRADDQTLVVLRWDPEGECCR
ncbi:MAG: PP2C family protein-serine/threonine phosphatase [Phycisphaerales bacterium]|nr:PP2C family protein-serine/threonine phosphatase [Phycisphaerales bacterium]